jgi:hypothetical protein
MTNELDKLFQEMAKTIEQIMAHFALQEGVRTIAQAFEEKALLLSDGK